MDWVPGSTRAVFHFAGGSLTSVWKPTPRLGNGHLTSIAFVNRQQAT